MSSSLLFDLQSLPLVCFERVLLSLDHYDFFHFSFSSKRAYQSAKTVAIRRKPSKLIAYIEASNSVYLTFEESYYFRIVVGNIPDDWDQLRPQSREYSINGMKFCGIFRNNCLTTYWNDAVYGSITVIDYLKNLFDISPHLLHASVEKFNNPTNFKKLLETLASFKSLFFTSASPTSPEKFVKIMEKVNPINCLISFSPVTCDSLEIDLSHLECKHFEVNWGNWLTVQHILQLRFFTFHSASNSKITSENINEILKKWLEGWNLNMRQLYLDMQKPNMNVILNGIEVEVKTQQDVREFMHFNVMNESYRKGEIKGGWEMKRAFDGAVARIVQLAPDLISVYCWSQDELETSQK